jgi:hypothetical protein
MVMLTTLPVGIDMDHHAAEVWQLVEQLVPDIPGNFMALRHRQAGRHRDAHVGVKSVTTKGLAAQKHQEPSWGGRDSSRRR